MGFSNKYILFLLFLLISPVKGSISVTPRMAKCENIDFRWSPPTEPIQKERSLHFKWIYHTSKKSKTVSFYRFNNDISNHETLAILSGEGSKVTDRMRFDVHKYFGKKNWALMTIQQPTMADFHWKYNIKVQLNSGCTMYGLPIAVKLDNRSMTFRTSSESSRPSTTEKSTTEVDTTEPTTPKWTTDADDTTISSISADSLPGNDLNIVLLVIAVISVCIIIILLKRKVISCVRKLIDSSRGSARAETNSLSNPSPPTPPAVYYSIHEDEMYSTSDANAATDISFDTIADAHGTNPDISNQNTVDASSFTHSPPNTSVGASGGHIGPGQNTQVVQVTVHVAPGYSGMGCSCAASSGAGCSCAEYSGPSHVASQASDYNTPIHPNQSMIPSSSHTSPGRDNPTSTGTDVDDTYLTPVLDV